MKVSWPGHSAAWNAGQKPSYYDTGPLLVQPSYILCALLNYSCEHLLHSSHTSTGYRSKREACDVCVCAQMCVTVSRTTTLHPEPGHTHWESGGVTWTSRSVLLSAEPPARGSPHTPAPGTAEQAGEHTHTHTQCQPGIISRMKANYNAFSCYLCISYLRVFKGVHDEYGESQAEDVRQEAGVEVRSCVLLQTERGGRAEDKSVTIRSTSSWNQTQPNQGLYLTSKRRSRAMKIPDRNNHSDERFTSDTSESSQPQVFLTHLPGMTMSPSPSMAKLLAPRPLSSRSCGNTTEGTEEWGWTGEYRNLYTRVSTPSDKINLSTGFSFIEAKLQNSHL